MQNSPTLKMKFAYTHYIQCQYYFAGIHRIFLIVLRKLLEKDKD